MMVVNNENFGKVLDSCLRLASEFQKVNHNSARGILFDKEHGRIQIISIFFYAEISDVRIDLDIPAGKPFFNTMFNEWIEPPFPKDINGDVRAMIESCKFVGMTQYYASNIINIISKDIEAVTDLKARYVFNHGCLPEGSAAVKFREENGKPVFKLANSPKRFEIADNSHIPADKVVPGVTYACRPREVNGIVELDVLKKFGKTSSGMFVSTTYYDSNCLPLLNDGSIIHPELTECSNVFEACDDIKMPPIHVSAILLYDALKLMLLNKTTKFNLHFQEKINTFVRLESVRTCDTDAAINIYLAPLDLSARIQRG